MKLSFVFSSLLAVVSLSAFVPATLNAHHGQDFLLLEDWHLPAPGGGHVMTNFEWERRSDHDEFSLAPSLMFGVVRRVALSLDADFRDESEGWAYRSIMPAAHFQLTGAESDSPFKIALSVGYLFADSAAAEDHEDQPAHGDGHGGGHEDLGHANSEGHVQSHVNSIHNHDSDALTSRLIIEGEFGATKALFNLISVVRDGGDASWGYAAGVRHKLREQLAVGVEALGDFQSDGWHEVVGGIFYEPVHSLTLKLGAGVGLTDATPDFTLRTGFVWRF